MSSSSAGDQSGRCRGTVHALLLAFLLMVDHMGATAIAETGAPKQKSEQTIQSLTPLIASEKRLSEAKVLAETTGVEILRRLVQKDESYAKRLGYDSLSQVTDGNLVALPPFPVFRIGLTQLQSYDGDAAKLLARKRPVQFIVPIAVDKREQAETALSAITVRLGAETKSGKIVQWGSRNLIRQLSSRRSELKIDLAPFLIEIPAFNRLYLGYFNAPGIVMLIPVSGVPTSEETGEQPIEEVFKALAIEARTAGDDPR